MALGAGTGKVESAGLKAIKYAEEKLKVHSVYDNAIKARNNLDECLDRLAEKRDKKRDLEERLKDLEMLIASEERGKHPDMSNAGMEAHLKIARNNNNDWREARERIIKTTSDIEGLEYDKVLFETDIKLAVARMNELGGLLNFFASIKNTQPIQPTQKEELK